MEKFWDLLGYKWWVVFFVLLPVLNMFPEQEQKPYSIFLAILLMFCIYGTWLQRRRQEDESITKPSNMVNGVFLGNFKGNPVGKNINDDGHVLVVGGAGSWKSAGIAIPTLRYFWDGRFLAVDIKGELAEKSKRKGLVFNPMQAGSYGYDPFYMAKGADDPEPYIRDIALSIVPTATKDPFWSRQAQDLLTGHLFFSFKQGVSFIRALRVLQSTPTEKVVDVGCRDEQSSFYLAQFADMADETLGSVKAELSSHVIPLATGSEIQSALSNPNIITPEMLEQGNNIFLQIPEHRINQWKQLITLILKQFLSHFERRSEANATPILFLLDEFPRFGKLEGILHGLATLRSKKITICIIIQSLAQLDAIYGHDERKVMADNCSYKAILGATDADTQRYFSQLVGTHEVRQYSRTAGFKSSSTTVSMAEKPRIKPEEFANLGNRVVLITPSYSGYAQKIGYWQMQDAKPITGVW
jgi:type IV secretion system protein VirD4